MSHYLYKPRFWGAAILALTLAVCVAPLVGTSQPPEGDAPVRIKVRLPANATLTVDGVLTKQTGSERDFISPALPAGRKFTYNFEATWTQDGKTRTVKKKLPVEAGRDYTIDFLKDTKGGKKDADKKEKGEKPKDADKKDVDKKEKDTDKKEDSKDEKKDGKKDGDKKDDGKKEDDKKDKDKGARGPTARETDYTWAAAVIRPEPGPMTRFRLALAAS